MLKLFWVALLSFVVIAPTAHAEMVRGHIRKNGTYVQPHFRSKADGKSFNNYSTKGNANPYTGQKGYVDPYAPKSSYPSNSRRGW